MKKSLPLVFVAIYVVFIGQSHALELKGMCSIHFASTSKAEEILQTRDAYIKALSPFDLKARMKNNGEIGERDFLDFIAAHALAWSPQEQQKLEKILLRIDKLLEPYNVYLPPKLYFIKTTGQEEGGAPYTRAGKAIILPVKIIALSQQQLFEMITHEIFHIISRNNPKLRSQLYSLIGFKKCSPISLPSSLKSLKITNPDAPNISHYIEVTINNKPRLVVPILLACEKKFKENPGENLFNYISLKFLPIEKHRGKWRYSTENKEVVTYDIEELSGYFEQVGMNTHYIIHPEEILAENFTLLLTEKKKLLSPGLLDKMERTLSSH